MWVFQHTLQMVWARTYAVSCGSFRCAELEGAEEANENALFLVCYYGPGWVCSVHNYKPSILLFYVIHSGNFANEPPYSTGSAPCGACPYTHEYCVNNLCCKYLSVQVDSGKWCMWKFSPVHSWIRSSDGSSHICSGTAADSICSVLFPSVMWPSTHQLVDSIVWTLATGSLHKNPINVVMCGCTCICTYVTLSLLSCAC